MGVPGMRARCPAPQAGPGFARCSEGPAPGYVVGGRIWPTSVCDKSLKLLSLFKSPPSFKSNPIKRLLLKEQTWHLGARLCHCCQYFQRWTKKKILSWIPEQTVLKLDLEGVKVTGYCHMAFVLFASDEATEERNFLWMVRSPLPGSVSGGARWESQSSGWWGWCCLDLRLEECS